MNAFRVPPIKVGDRWEYDVKAEQIQNGSLVASSRKYEAWIVRVGSHSFVMANKAGDSKLPPHEASLTVLGWEEVTVPAGKFKALKIEMEGTKAN